MRLFNLSTITVCLDKTTYCPVRFLFPIPKMSSPRRRGSNKIRNLVKIPNMHSSFSNTQALLN
jgi:hypothetical protein